MANLLIPPKYREFDDNGDPLVGGKLYSYLAGTTTPAATYTDSTGATPNTNPVVLDADGRGNVWLNSSTTYKFVLRDAEDNILWTVDNVSGSGSSSSGSGSSAVVTHDITDGQSAADLDGETLDLDDYTSALYEGEILRGTTVLANIRFAIQNVGGTGRVRTGESVAGEAHGVTFSVSQAGSVVQLRAACSSGPGDGTIKISRTLYAV